MIGVYPGTNGLLGELLKSLLLTTLLVAHIAVFDGTIVDTSSLYLRRPFLVSLVRDKNAVANALVALLIHECMLEVVCTARRSAEIVEACSNTFLIFYHM